MHRPLDALLMKTQTESPSECSWSFRLPYGWRHFTPPANDSHANWPKSVTGAFSWPAGPPLSLLILCDGKLVEGAKEITVFGGLCLPRKMFASVERNSPTHTSLVGSLEFDEIFVRRYSMQV